MWWRIPPFGRGATRVGRGHESGRGRPGGGSWLFFGGSSGASGSAGEGGASDDDCVEAPLVERRLVRLTANQIVNSVETMLGAGVAAAIRAQEDIPSSAQRSFPPINGETPIGPVQFSFADRVGDLVGQSVRDTFDACGDAPTDECGREYVLDFAEKAFRRPLRDVEGENLITVYDECKAQGASVAEAVRHGGPRNPSVRSPGRIS